MSLLNEVSYGTVNATAVVAGTVTGRLVSSRYEFVDAGRGLTAAGGATAGGDTTETITRNLPASTTDLVLAGYNTTNDTDNQNPVSIIQTNRTSITAVMATDPSTAHNFDWMALRNGAAPAYQVFAAGNFTTAGGDAAESIPVTGVLAGDLCLVQVKSKGATPVVVSAAITAAGAITVTMSADPATDHVLNYIVLRPPGGFTPSHYVFAAGDHTTVGGAVTETITVTGAKTGDIAFACYNTTNDTDLVVDVAAVTNGVLVEMSADPVTAHKLSYFVLRAA